MDSVKWFRYRYAPGVLKGQGGSFEPQRPEEGAPFTILQPRSWVKLDVKGDITSSCSRGTDLEFCLSWIPCAVWVWGWHGNREKSTMLRRRRLLHVPRGKLLWKMRNLAVPAVPTALAVFAVVVA